MKIYNTGKDKWAHEQKVSGGIDEWHSYLGPCPECGARTFNYGGGWRCVAQYCSNNAGNPAPSVGPTPTWWDTDINVYMDGNAWCATRDDFIDLQQSNAGFGDTPREAVKNLLESEGS